MTERKVNIDSSHASIGVGYSEKVEAEQIGGTINNYSPEQKQTLAEAAKEVQELLDQLSETYPTETVAEKSAVAAKAIEQIEKKPDVKGKVLKALKAGGVAALMELTNNPVVKILTPMLESLLEESK
jgi:predicted transcriptional regulator